MKACPGVEFEAGSVSGRVNTMNPSETPQPVSSFSSLPDGYRRLAWNGISFAVPANWEIAVFRLLRRGASRIELEDDYSLRMEAEWMTRHKGDLDTQSIQKRYEAASKPLTVKAEEQTEIQGLPEGWHATCFIFRETGEDKKGGSLEVVEHSLATAFYLCPESTMFGFFLLHFMPEDPEDPMETVRQLAGAFQTHRGQPHVPWKLYDIEFELPAAFNLEKATIDIGSKLMRFGWKWRQFSLWHFSCYDMFLKDGMRGDVWAAGFLNAYGGFKWIRFDPDGRGGIAWRRRKPFIFGHRSEIARLCFKYRVGWRLHEQTRQLVLWVYHYRKKTDLLMLPDAFQ